MSLTEEQIKRYDEDGFLVIDDVFSEKDLADLRVAAASEAIQAA